MRISSLCCGTLELLCFIVLEVKAEQNPRVRRALVLGLRPYCPLLSHDCPSPSPLIVFSSFLFLLYPVSGRHLALHIRRPLRFPNRTCSTSAYILNCISTSSILTPPARPWRRTSTTSRLCLHLPPLAAMRCKTTTPCQTHHDLP